MSIVIITLRDTENGVEVKQQEVPDQGEVNTPAIMLGAAMFDNVNQYLKRHPHYGKSEPKTQQFH